MKGAQDVRKEREAKRANEQLKREENVEIIESLIIDKFKELKITTVVVWELDDFFVIDEDLTDIPFDKDCESTLYKDFNNEAGFYVSYIKMIGGKTGLKIRIVD
jgi:hypothetical protein